MRFRVLFLVFFLPLLIGTAAGGYLAISKGTPSISELKEYRKTTGAKIYADDGVLIGEIKEDRGVFMPYERAPEHLVNAIVAVEDSNFWLHKGIDYTAILRAALKDVLHRRIKEGGSTITQQLAKITFLTPEKTIKRKLREAALAVKIEKDLTKEEILELYMNRAYFGHGAYGAEAASRKYFGKGVGQLKLHEAAMLAGLLKAPSTYSPFNNLRSAKQRQTLVLKRMQEEGYLTGEEREKAEKTPLFLSTREEDEETFNYFIDFLRRHIIEKYGAEKALRGGLRVHTTLDRALQLEAQRALKNGLRAVDKRRGWRGPIDHKTNPKPAEENHAFEPPSLRAGDFMIGSVVEVSGKKAILNARGVAGTLPLEGALWASTALDLSSGKRKRIENFGLGKILKPGDVVRLRVESTGKGGAVFSLDQEPEVQGAVVAVDPKTGYIRALVGGYDYRKSEFNRAAHAKRQPGSAFKPVIYATAMENGFTPGSLIVDEPVTYRWGSGGVWSPDNYDGKYQGPVTLRAALAYSRNVVTVKLVDEMGVDKVRDLAGRIGIEAELPRNLSIALGSTSITPLNLVLSYSAFANGGMRVNPVFIKYITDSRGRIIESNEPQSREVISPETARLVTSMMQDVVRYGTGWRAKAIGRPSAGKTGTTNDFRDAWFIGYTTGLLAGVWVGMDDVSPIGPAETGSKAASPIWVEFMKTVPQGGEALEFEALSGWESFFMNTASGEAEPDVVPTAKENLPGEDFSEGEGSTIKNPDFD